MIKRAEYAVLVQIGGLEGWFLLVLEAEGSKSGRFLSKNVEKSSKITIFSTFSYICRSVIDI